MARRPLCAPRPMRPMYPMRAMARMTVRSLRRVPW